MNELENFAKALSPNKDEAQTVRNLYLAMKAVGGYEQLMNLPLPALREILKCVEWEEKETSKSFKK